MLAQQRLKLEQEIIINKKLSHELQQWQQKQKHLLEQFTSDSMTLQVFQGSLLQLQKYGLKNNIRKYLNRLIAH